MIKTQGSQNKSRRTLAIILSSLILIIGTLGIISVILIANNNKKADMNIINEMTAYENDAYVFVYNQQESTNIPKIVINDISKYTFIVIESEKVIMIENKESLMK